MSTTPEQTAERAARQSITINGYSVVPCWGSDEWAVLIDYKGRRVTSFRFGSRAAAITDAACRVHANEITADEVAAMESASRARFEREFGTD